MNMSSENSSELIILVLYLYQLFAVEVRLIICCSLELRAGFLVFPVKPAFVAEYFVSVALFADRHGNASFLQL